MSGEGTTVINLRPAFNTNRRKTLGDESDRFPGHGGDMAAASARGYLVEFGAPPIPYIFNIPEVAKALDENGGVLEERLHARFDKMMSQLSWWATALRRQRDLEGDPKWDGMFLSKSVSL
jgi:NAD(P)H-dependent FMN reductase